MFARLMDQIGADEYGKMQLPGKNLNGGPPCSTDW